jgi:hypothetical protein
MNGVPGRGHTDPGPGYMAKLRADLGTQWVNVKKCLSLS